MGFPRRILWRHKNFKDVDFLPYQTDQQRDGALVLEGWWVRRDFGAGAFVLGSRPDRIRIKAGDLLNWSTFAD